MVQYTPEVHELPKYDIAADLKDASSVAHLILGAAMSAYTTLIKTPEDYVWHDREEGAYDAYILSLGFALKGARTTSEYEDALREWIEGQVA